MACCLAFLVGAPLGCRCQDAESSKVQKPPTPLVEKAAPPDLKASVFPATGATSERPVLLVAAEETSVCTQVRELIDLRGHVLCTRSAPEQVDEALRAALLFLKKTYGGYVASAPVILVTDRARSRVGFRLMLQEPAFFAVAYLPGLEEKVLTATSLAALHEQGARALVVSLEPTNRLKLLANVSERRGLSLVALGSNGALQEALDQALGADPRWTDPPASAP